MSSTALGAKKAKENIFISDAHEKEKFYYEKLKEARYQNVYHKVLVYCLGVSDDTRRNIYSIPKGRFWLLKRARKNIIKKNFP